MSKRITVLIVEDEDILREGICKVISLDDRFTVVGEAINGIEAVDLAAKTSPDVIVMDIHMPEMDGIEATRIIKQARPAVNVVMLTSDDSDTEIFAALSAGAAGYCLKDCAFERIKIAVASVAEGAAWIDPRIAHKVLKAFEAHRLAKAEKADAPHSDPLSVREKDVLRLLVDGASNKEISDKLIISISTVRTHVEHILEKLAVTGRTAAAVKALKDGLI